MHDTAYEIGRGFFETYWSDRFRRILDVGAQNVNGTLRDFCPPDAEYVGVDLEPGADVDVVLDELGSFPFEDRSFDLVVSTSCMEHDQMFWLTFAEMGRILRDGGYIYINAPSNGYYHSFPYDNWRFYPDAGLALIGWARKVGLNLSLVESFTARRKKDVWNDCVMVFRKGTAARKPGQYLSDRFCDAFNIRREGEEEVTNFCELPEDGQIIQALERARNGERACNGEIAALQDALARRDGQIESLNRTVAERDAQIRDLHGSTSWRVTAPLRALKSRIRRPSISRDLRRN